MNRMQNVVTKGKMHEEYLLYMIMAIRLSLKKHGLSIPTLHATSQTILEMNL